MKASKQDVVTQFKTARRVSAPLVAIKTPDPAATMAGIMTSYGENCPPVVVWDCVKGLRGANPSGEKSAAAAISEDPTANPVAALVAATQLIGAKPDAPRGTILFMQNIHRFLDAPDVAQAIWNLRDLYKADRRTLVLLAPEITLPAELSNDVLVLDEPLPGEEQLAEIVKDVCKSGGLDALSAKALTQAVNATTGLAAFPAEQVAAMSLEGKTLNGEALWERKRQTIEQTPGLSVWNGGETYSDLAGLDNVKNFLGRYIKGKKAPRVIVFIDEIEKALAGLSSDSSGTTQDQLGELLKFMQNSNVGGVLLLGPAGTGKSQLTKATANEAKVPCVELDLGAMKDKHIGESEGRIRSAIKVIKAIGQDRILVIATCNSIGILPPELRRRFKSGTFFMDLPSAAERAALWDLFTKKHGLKKQALPDDNGWTGAEIEQACSYAADFTCSLKEAAAFIVPVAKSAADVISRLRSQATGKYISASKPGLYEPEREEKAQGRAVQSGEGEY